MVPQNKRKYDSRVKGNILKEGVMFALLTRKRVELSTFTSSVKCHYTERNFSLNVTPQNNTRSFGKSTKNVSLAQVLRDLYDF